MTNAVAKSPDQRPEFNSGEKITAQMEDFLVNLDKELKQEFLYLIKLTLDKINTGSNDELKLAKQLRNSQNLRYSQINQILEAETNEFLTLEKLILSEKNVPTDPNISDSFKLMRNPLYQAVSYTNSYSYEIKHNRYFLYKHFDTILSYSDTELLQKWDRIVRAYTDDPDYYINQIPKENSLTFAGKTIEEASYIPANLNDAELEKLRYEAWQAAKTYLGLDINEENWNMLIRTTFAEATHELREESYCMAVILNRVRSQRWGDTVKSVVTAKFQFESVTGSTGTGFNPSSVYLTNHSKKQLQMLYDAAKNLLNDNNTKQPVPKDLIYFTALNPNAYSSTTGLTFLYKLSAYNKSIKLTGTVFSPEFPNSYVWNASNKTWTENGIEVGRA